MCPALQICWGPGGIRYTFIADQINQNNIPHLSTTVLLYSVLVYHQSGGISYTLSHGHFLLYITKLMRSLSTVYAQCLYCRFLYSNKIYMVTKFILSFLYIQPLFLYTVPKFIQSFFSQSIFILTIFIVYVHFVNC